MDHMNDEQLGNKKLWWAKQVSSPFIDTHHTPHTTHTHTPRGWHSRSFSAWFLRLSCADVWMCVSISRDVCVSVQIEEVEKEVQKRGLSVAQLRRLEPDSTGDGEHRSDDSELEDEEDEDASEGDNDILLGDYRKNPSNYRQENYTQEDGEAADGEAEEGDGGEPGDYRRG